MKFNLKGWKKIKEADDHAILKNHHGHELKIAKKSLPKQLLSQLSELPSFSEGGDVPDKDKQKQQDGSKEMAEKFGKRVQQGGSTFSEGLDNLKKAVGLADGGQVPDKDKKKEPPKGGAVPGVNEDLAKKSDEYYKEQTISKQLKDAGQNLKKAIGFDEGGDVEQPLDIQSASDSEVNDQKPLDIVAVADEKPLDIQPASDAEVGQQEMPAMEPQAIPAQSPQEARGIAALSSALSVIPEESPPSLSHGYQQQLQGIQEQAQAEAQGAQKQAKLLDISNKIQQRQAQEFQKSLNSLNQERQALTADINNNLIDPKKYWDNHSKVAAAIGLILGGFNPTSRPNAAMELLHSQMEQNLQAQAQNLGAKRGLLEANMHQFGNLHQAMEMTRIMQNDMVANQLKAEAMRSSDPAIKARALQAAGQLEQSIAPAFQKLAMQQSLKSVDIPNENDPASYVRALVDNPDQQNKVFAEIKVAQDTKRMGSQIMQSFEQAVKDNTTLNRLKNAQIREPASVKALHQAMQPTFADLEGTVRQAAMDNTFSNITPVPGNTAEDIATKRNALKQYLKSKSSAPIAKGFGIDLNKFSSTSTDPRMSLNPQQKQFLDWAEANPKDPRSPLILKKLGIQ